MPRYAPNKMSPDVKRRYFELIRQGLSGSATSSQVGVSLSCGSLWFIDAGSVDFVDKPISRRYLTWDLPVPEPPMRQMVRPLRIRRPVRFPTRRGWDDDRLSRNFENV